MITLTIMAGRSLIDMQRSLHYVFLFVHEPVFVYLS